MPAKQRKSKRQKMPAYTRDCKQEQRRSSSRLAKSNQRALKSWGDLSFHVDKNLAAQEQSLLSGLGEDFFVRKLRDDGFLSFDDSALPDAAASSERLVRYSRMQ
jgi:hypothetical protein